MEKVIAYRAIAAQLRREAMSVALERERQIKIAAAERWDDLAAEIEMVVAPSTASVRQEWFF